jgi:hypothetical protein
VYPPDKTALLFTPECGLKSGQLAIKTCVNSCKSLAAELKDIFFAAEATLQPIQNVYYRLQTSWLYLHKKLNLNLSKAEPTLMQT